MPAVDLREFEPLSKVVGAAAMDMYEDAGKVERSYYHWGARGIEKLTRESLKSGRRSIILTVNKNLNNAILPCDFKEALFVGYIDECGEKVAIAVNSKIADPSAEIIPCDVECEAKCQSCYNKQMCNDLQTMQVINKITINDVEYDETVTSTLLENGEYFVVKTTPVYNYRTGEVDFIDQKKYVTTFDVAACGCIKETEDNCTKLKENCWDVYCCYCSCKKEAGYKGGYKIFMETGIIQFDRDFCFDKAYIEYRGGLPKRGNDYIIPKVAFETLVNFIKFKSIENKKGVSRTDKDWYWERFTTERGNMIKNLGKNTLANILRSVMTVPKFDYNGSHNSNHFVNHFGI